MLRAPAPASSVREPFFEFWDAVAFLECLQHDRTNQWLQFGDLMSRLRCMVNHSFGWDTVPVSRRSSSVIWGVNRVCLGLFGDVFGPGTTTFDPSRRSARARARPGASKPCAASVDPKVRPIQFRQKKKREPT